MPSSWTHTTTSKSSPLTQTSPWTNPYLQRNTQAEQQPTNTVKPPTTEEWLKDNIMLRAIETRQAQLQQQAIQAKLTVGEPGDKYEQEADMMASRVMSMPDTAVQTNRQKRTVNSSFLKEIILSMVRLT